MITEEVTDLFCTMFAFCKSWLRRDSYETKLGCMFVIRIRQFLKPEGESVLRWHNHGVERKHIGQVKLHIS